MSWHLRRQRMALQPHLQRVLLANHLLRDGLNAAISLPKRVCFLRLLRLVLDWKCLLDLCGCFISTYDGYRSILAGMPMGYPCEIATVMVYLASTAHHS